jgi:oxygen-independent coproporphyrinogen-3 oxidase
MLYWTDGDWWGFGPGAHSHVGGTRWWNVRHPSAYATRLAAGESPAAGREILGPDERAMEQVMLGLRLADGLSLSALGGPAKAAAEASLGRGYLDDSSWQAGKLVLTRDGRLLADAIIRDLT